MATESTFITVCSLELGHVITANFKKAESNVRLCDQFKSLSSVNA